MRRNEIPESLNDPSTWPGVDPSALDTERRATYLRREQAVHAYLSGTPLAEIERNCRVNRGTLQRLVERCLMPHADGRIQGLRALIPHTRAKFYRRIAPALRRAKPGGLTGAMGQLFDRLPQLLRIVERDIASGMLGLSQGRRLFGLRDVQSKLLAACREAGLTAKDYPLNHDEMGYLDLELLRLLDRAVTEQNKMLTEGVGNEGTLAASLPFVLQPGPGLWATLRDSLGFEPARCRSG